MGGSHTGRGSGLTAIGAERPDGIGALLKHVVAQGAAVHQHTCPRSRVWGVRGGICRFYFIYSSQCLYYDSWELTWVFQRRLCLKGT